MKVIRVEFMQPTNFGGSIAGITAATVGNNNVAALEVDNSTGIVTVKSTTKREFAIYPANIKAIEYVPVEKAPAPAPLKK